MIQNKINGRGTEMEKQLKWFAVFAIALCFLMPSANAGVVYQPITDMEYDTIAYVSEDGLIGIKNGKYGMQNLNGQILIPYEYDRIETVEDSVSGKTYYQVIYYTDTLQWISGIYGETGEILPCEFYQIQIAGDVACVTKLQDRVYYQGAYSLQTGKEIIPFDYPTNYLGEKEGYEYNLRVKIQTDGEKICDTFIRGERGTESDYFKLDGTRISTLTLEGSEYQSCWYLGSERYMAVDKNGKMGVIDQDGNTVIDFKYSLLMEMYKDRYWAEITNDQHVSQYGALDGTGAVICPFMDSFGPYNAVMNKDQAYYDIEGHYITSDYTPVEKKRDVWVVSNGEYEGAVYTGGEMVLPVQYGYHIGAYQDQAHNWDGELILFATSTEDRTGMTNYAVVNLQGDVILQGNEYANVYLKQDYIICVNQSSEIVAIYDANGNKTVPQHTIKGEITNCAGEGLFIVQDDGIYSVVTIEGVPIIAPNTYKQIVVPYLNYDVAPNMVAVSNGSKWGVVQVGQDTSTPSEWAASEIEQACKLGLVPESLNGAYQTPCTRIEFCQLITTLIETVSGQSIDEYITTAVTNDPKITFTDTSDANVIAASQLGIINGMGDGTFRPNSNIKRQEAAKMLVIASNLFTEEGDTNCTFDDTEEIMEWARPFIAQASDKGLMSGVGNNRFNGSGFYTREQSFLTMLRLYQQITNE